MTAAITTLFFERSSGATPGVGVAIALNAEGGLPERVQLLPRGPIISGMDARRWRLEDPLVVVRAFAARGLQLPIDLNHAQFLKAPKGEDSPAAGWIENLYAEDGAIWARVSWTPSGADALNARAYRYLSPVLRSDASGNVVEIIGAGLVNIPNFTMGALNARCIEDVMDKDLLINLGLPETATVTEAVAAAKQMRLELNAAKTPPSLSLATAVPRADYDLVLARATNAEAALNAAQSQQMADKAAAIVNAAIKDGKIAPVSKDFYLSTCASVEGLQNFEKFIAESVSVFQASGLEKKDPAVAGSGVSLNAEQKNVAIALGLDAKAFAAFLADQNAGDQK